MIEVQNLSKSYGGFQALQNASFTLNKKYGVTALLGPNGAGKTTTLRLIAGYLQPSSGTVRINNLDLGQDNHVAIKSQIGYLPENTPLYPEMLVSEYLTFMGQMRGLGGQTLEDRAKKMVEMLELDSHFYTPIGLLSKGFKQRVALAATLIHKPDYIILDEPTSGLDPNQIQHIRQLIKSLGKDQTLLLSTHILQEVEDICDRVIILSRGRVVADESTAVLRQVQSCRIVVKGKDVEKSLSSLDIVASCKKDSAQELPQDYEAYICELKENCPEKVFAYIAGAGLDWQVRELAPLSRSLQQVFQDITA